MDGDTMKKSIPIRGYLAPDVILRMLINKDAKSEELLQRVQHKEIELLTSVFALFEAIASIEEKTDTLDVEVLKKIMKYVKISSEMEEDLKMGYETFNDKRKEHLRKVALQ